MTKRKKTFTSNKENSKTIEEHITDYNSINRTLSPHVIRSKNQILRKLAHYLENNTNHKSLRKATKEDLKKFFTTDKYVKDGSHNLTGSVLIPFFRFVYEIDDVHLRPPNMGWFRTISKRAKLRNNDTHRKDKLLLTPYEYKKIIEYSKDFYGQNKAIWEIYYLSGFRPEELTSMNIEDVKEDKNDNIVWVSCPNSKTCPRPIPLSEYPENLIRYLGNHPKRNDKKAPLFFNIQGSTKLQRLRIQQIERRFRQMREKLKLKPTLVIKSFRKTRATIMFNSDDPMINNDTTICKYMGWSPTTVVLRRLEYNLTDFEDLKKAICKKPMISKSYDRIEAEKNEIEKGLKNDMEHMKKIYENVIGQLKADIHELKHQFDDFENNVLDERIREKIQEQLYKEKEAMSPEEKEEERKEDIRFHKRMMELERKEAAKTPEQKAKDAEETYKEWQRRQEIRIKKNKSRQKK